MPKKPNVVLLTWHDAGRWFGCYGNPSVQTPNIDQMAGQGCRFENAISACAICSPSRAAMMTGRFCQENGVMTLTNTSLHNRIFPDKKHFAKILKENGYHSALFGVQHETSHEHVQSIMDFDEQLATDPWPKADVSADCFEQWVAGQSHDRPFYAQIGFHEAHLGSFFGGNASENYPYAFDDEKGTQFPPYIKESEFGAKAVGTLQGYLKRGDEAFGRILNALKQNGFEDNTLVMMCVDHGVGLPRAKMSCYDPGIAVAWLLRWPGVIPAGTVVKPLATHVDFLPTVLDLLRIDPPATTDGVNFSRHVKGESQDELNDYVFSHMVENIRSVRSRSYKFIRNFHPPRRWQSVPVSCDEYAQGVKSDSTGQDPAGMPHVELYDLRDDPNEFHNLADDPVYADILGEFDRCLWDFLFDHDDFVIHEPVRTPWQVVTRKQMERYCKSSERTAPHLIGPLAGEVGA